MKSLQVSDRDISKFVLKNFPQGLSTVSKFMERYIKSLFSSEDILDAFARLDSYTEFGLIFDTESSSWVQEDALHFILSDFCSSVGVIYKPEYREPILRSFVGKTLDFFQWLFSDYMGFPLLGSLSVQRSGSALGIFSTDDEGFTDMRPTPLFTDRFVRAYINLVVPLDHVVLQEDPFVKLSEFKELLSLVLPAFITVVFV